MTQHESEVEVQDMIAPQVASNEYGRAGAHATPAGDTIDAMELLSRDHEALRQLFRDFEALLQRGDVADQKAALVEKICQGLTIHAEIEEQLFYPAVRSAIRRAMLPWQAAVDHSEDRELVAMIDEMTPDHPDFDGAIAFLAAYVLPHMALEETELFPLLRRSGMESLGLGRQMNRTRKLLYEGAARARVARRSPPPKGWPPAMPAAEA
jgi:hemerythrin-like domain-containing protein